MANIDMKKALSNLEYDFLRNDVHLGDRICYLTLGGSRAYGTNNENSDIDVRGIVLERPKEIYGNQRFEQFEDRATDTIIYGLKKYVNLCISCNPNVIEMLGTREEDIILINDVGKIIRDNRKLFLTKRAYVTFSGYATMQLRRLQNALAHDSYPEAEKEKHILKSIQSMQAKTLEEYSLHEGDIEFYIPEDGEQTIHANVNIKGVPLRRFIAMNSDLNNMLRNYAKLNHRNKKKDELHLYKHAMHLIRLYITGIDILRNGEINTYREKELPLLMGIRRQEISLDAVFAMAEKYEKEMAESYKESELPEFVDIEAVDDLLVSIYKKYLR